MTLKSKVSKSRTHGLPHRDENVEVTGIDSKRMDEAVLFSMAQALGVQVRPEAVRSLLPDAEYTLREVISVAKSFMRHSKRHRLAENDVNMATNLFDSMLASRSRSERCLMRDENVRYPISNLKVLKDLYKDPLPLHPPEIALHGLWLQGNKSEQSTSISVANDKILPHIAQNGDLGPPENSEKSKRISLEEDVNQLVSLVNTHVAPTGRPEVLIATVHAVAAFLMQNSYETEKHRDDILRCALSCILGSYPMLKIADSLTARELVTMALAQWKEETSDRLAVARVCKTLFAAVLDTSVPIDALFGAITAIVALGEDIYGRYLTPHFPALLHSLENRMTEAIGQADEDTRFVIDRICQTLSKTLEILTPDS